MDPGVRVIDVLMVFSVALEVLFIPTHDELG